MAIIVRCPGCGKFRALTYDVCDCGFDLKGQRRINRVPYYARMMVKGRRRRYPLGNKLTYARNEEARLKAENADTGHVGSRQKITVGDYFRRFFLPEQKRKNKSWDKVQERYKNHLKSVFGSMRIAAIQGHHVQSYINGRMAEKNHKNQLPKPATVNRELAILKRLINQARGDGLFVGENPVFGKTAGRETRNFGTALTRAQAAALIAALPETNVGMLIEFALATGLRFGNVAGLKWSDIDLENGRLNDVEMKAGPDGIPLSRWALDILGRVHRVPGNDVVFVHVDPRFYGRPYRDVRGTYEKALKAAGIPKIRIHDLRHTFGSWLGDERVNEKTIARLLNHKQTATTSRYTHPAEDALRATADHIRRPEPSPDDPAQGGAQNGKKQGSDPVSNISGGAQSGAQSRKIIPFRKKTG